MSDNRGSWWYYVPTGAHDREDFRLIPKAYFLIRLFRFSSALRDVRDSRVREDDKLAVALSACSVWEVDGT